jgi:hypothetical protein
LRPNRAYDGNLSSKGLMIREVSSHKTPLSFRKGLMNLKTCKKSQYPNV